MLTGRQKIALRDGIIAKFTESDWKRFAVLAGLTDWLDAHDRLLRSRRFGDDDYPGHVLAAIRTSLEDSAQAAHAFVAFTHLCDWLAENHPDVLAVLSQVAESESPPSTFGYDDLLDLHSEVVSRFKAADWEEFVVLAEQPDRLDDYPRLLRALSFGDDDYDGWALDILRAMLEASPDETIEALRSMACMVGWSPSARTRKSSRDAPPDAEAFGGFELEFPPGGRERREPAPPVVTAGATEARVTSDAAGLDHGGLAEGLVRLRRIAPGVEGATLFQHGVAALLAALFAPHLTDMKFEDRINGGRQRVDISFTNRATGGFFRWFAVHYGSVPNIFVEAKNYAADPANPELDQLAGRLSGKRGRLGLLACRNIEDRKTMSLRCRDRFNDSGIYILAIDDDDIAQLVEGAERHGRDEGVFQHLKRRLDELVK